MIISGESAWEGDLGSLVELLSFVVVTGVTGEPCVGEFGIREESKSSESPSGSRDSLKFSSNEGV